MTIEYLLSPTDSDPVPYLSTLTFSRLHELVDLVDRNHHDLQISTVRDPLILASSGLQGLWTLMCANDRDLWVVGVTYIIKLSLKNCLKTSKINFSKK